MHGKSKMENKKHQVHQNDFETTMLLAGVVLFRIKQKVDFLQKKKKLLGKIEREKSLNIILLTKYCM